MSLLGRALRVDAQPHALSGGLCRGAEAFQLAGGVEHDVIRIAQQLVELVRPVRAAEHVNLLPRHLLGAQARLVEAAGLRACQIGLQHRVEIKI